MSQRQLRPVPLLLAAVVLCVSLPSPAQASTNATGNAAAIALYARAVATTNALAVLKDTDTNYYFLKDNVTSLSSSGFHLQRGVPRAPAGYVDARVVETYRVLHAKVQWIETTVAPACGRSPACTHSVALEFLDTSAGEKVAYLSGAATAYCWAQTFSPANSYFGGTIGLSVWSVSGKFLPVTRSASQDVFTSQYSSGGQTITETDWVALSSDRFVRSLYQGSAIGQYPAFSFRVVESDPSTVPAPPNYKNCAG